MKIYTYGGDRYQVSTYHMSTLFRIAESTEYGLIANGYTSRSFTRLHKAGEIQEMLELGAGAISTYSRLALSMRLSSCSESIQKLLEQDSHGRYQLHSLGHKYCNSVGNRHIGRSGD